MKIKKSNMRALIRSSGGSLTVIGRNVGLHRTTIGRKIAADPDLLALLELERNKRREGRVRALHAAASERARARVAEFERHNERVSGAQRELGRMLAALSYGQIRDAERALELQLEALRPLRSSAKRARKRLAELEAELS